MPSVEMPLLKGTLLELLEDAELVCKVFPAGRLEVAWGPSMTPVLLMAFESFVGNAELETFCSLRLILLSISE